jgi:hypothetical protein
MIIDQGYVNLDIDDERVVNQTERGLDILDRSFVR